MNVVLNVNLNKKLEDNDILVYCNGYWTNLSKEEYLRKLKNDINELKEKLSELDDLKKKVAELRGED